MDPNRHMVISPRWLWGAIGTFIVGFAVLIYLAFLIQAQHPPVPRQVVTESGNVLFTSDDILAGQHVFQKYGFMQHGTLFGHGAYLGPDFTAEYLHHATNAMRTFHEGQGLSPTDAAARVEQESKTNRYDPESGTLVYTDGQAHALATLTAFYDEQYSTPAEPGRLQPPRIWEASERAHLAKYFSWAAWVASTLRPGEAYSYTNNWPPEPAVGNRPTADALVWSALSLIALLGGTGIVFFVFGRYGLLGWHEAGDRPGTLEFRPPDEVRLTPAQRATAWYFLVVAALFLGQGLLGGANAHYHVEPGGFYELNLAAWLPYRLTRTWHVQLALFFVATSYLAMGIFIAPMIAGREPKHQDKLTLALFGAVVLVVFGSLAGEAISYHAAPELGSGWYWIGAQGWEYLDLGRLWQVLLVAGMAIWVVILIRGLWTRLPGEHRGNLPWLFMYSAVTIPLFYAAGLMFGKATTFAVVDFWRFWVVHLWVEDFLELFTTIMVAYIFVLLGVVRPVVATRVVYLDIILYSVGGVIGTMHHLYFSGAPATHMALGAFFSAMEVIPLVLLTFEAWRFMRLGGGGEDTSVVSTSAATFPHKWAVMFLIAVGFWNFLGAGVFGFLINTPIISYYEIGTQFTANHGHGAMMGVYGMLAIGFFMFAARYFIPRDQGSERAMRISFWSLNIGLAWMLFANLVPMGILQLHDSFQNGYWHARSHAFFDTTLARVFEWSRLPGDALFIVGGIGPLLYLAARMLKERNRYQQLPAGEPTERFMKEQEPDTDSG